MNLLIVLILAAIYSTSIKAEDSQLVIILGHVQELRVSPPEASKTADPASYNLDHACGKEQITFSAKEYLAGDGPSTVNISNRLSFPSCEPHWVLGSSIAVLSDFGRYQILRDIISVHEFDGEPFMLFEVPNFLNAVSIGKPVDHERLLRPIETLMEENPKGYWNPSEGSHELGWLKDIGFLSFKYTQANVDLSCGSECAEGPFFPVIEVEYLKGIPISAVRDYGF